MLLRNFKGEMKGQGVLAKASKNVRITSISSLVLSQVRCVTHIANTTIKMHFQVPNLGTD